MMNLNEGILLVDKPVGLSSFAIVYRARKKLGVKKIGHGGTLDPFASGLLILLVGRSYTKRASEFLLGDKGYLARICLGSATDSFDPTGERTDESSFIPSLAEIEAVIATFQGEISQVPPMFSAKKIGGKRLYELARQGKSVERQAVTVHVQIEIISYCYPHLDIAVTCSKGTYIRSLAHDIGLALGCFAHLETLRRTHSGSFCVENACPIEFLDKSAGNSVDHCLDRYFQR